MYMRPSRLLLRNTISFLGGNFLSAALLAVQFILLARLLGAAEFGRVAALSALVAVFAPFSGLGYGTVMLMRVARNIRESPVQLGNAIASTCVLGLGLAAVATVLAIILFDMQSYAWFVVVFAVSELVIVRTCAIFGSFLQALGRIDSVNILNSAVAFCKAASVVAVTADGTLDLEAWAIVNLALLSILCLSVGWWLVLTYDRPTFDWRVLWGERSNALHFSLGTVARNCYTDIDKIILALCASSAVVGLYTSAYRIVSLSFMPVRSLLLASATQGFKIGEQGVNSAANYVRHILKISIAYGILAAIGIFICAPLLPMLLGPSYADSVQMLRVLALLPLIQTVHYLYSDVLSFAGLQSLRSKLQYFVAAIYTILAVITIPLFGWPAAAVVCLASETLLAVLVVHFVTVKSVQGSI